MVYSKLLGYHLTFIQIMSKISIRDHKGVGMEWQDLQNNPEGKASYGGAGSKKPTEWNIGDSYVQIHIKRII